ncbi:MAG: heparinase II/III-family protein [Deltaproteobacteria bacterium]|nr:heparinase II/III-family protein [Deltaproteobacteria bacterium]
MGRRRVFAALNGEHDKARLSGIGHEQADATSFVLHALGEYFVIDSGYINWSERLRVAGATHHNLVLVDGEGPSLGLLYVFADADAWLDEFTDETAWRSARVYSEYEGASVSRRVAVVGEDYFITEERVAADAPRTFTWQSHMNAGGDTDGTFTPLADGALVERPLAVLRTYLQSLPGPPSFGTRVDEHAASHSVAGTHNVLTADVAADEARFLSLHLVAAEKADLPEVTNASAGELLINVVGGDGYLDAVISSPGGAFEIEPDEDIGTIRSDAELVWVRVDPDAGALIDHQILEGTYFERDP